MPKKFRITCKASASVPLKKLKAFPGNPKDLTEEEEGKLANEILVSGFCKSLSVWTAEDNKMYVLDGNQRLKVKF